MASFTATLDEGKYIPQSGNVGQAVSEAGGWLNAAAQVVDTGSKIGVIATKNAEARDRKAIAGGLEAKLFSEAMAYGTQTNTTPNLLGEGGSAADEAASRNPAVQSAVADIDKFSAGKAQGRISQEEFLTRTSVITQRVIQDHPEYADYIRDHAKSALGVVPTQALVGLQSQEQQAVRELNQGVQKGLVEKAASHGIVYFDNGAVNVEKTAEAGQAIAATEAKMSKEKAELELESARRTAATAGKPTLAEVNDGEFRIVKTALSDVLDHSVESALTRVSSLVAQARTLPESQQAAEQARAVGEIKASFLGLANSMMNKQNLSADTIEKAQKWANDQFKPIEDLFTGPLSSVETRARALKDYVNVTKTDLQTSAPGFAKLVAIGGDQAASAIITQQVLTNGKLSTTLQDELKSYLDPNSNAPTPYKDIAQTTGVLEGKVDITKLQPNEQKSVIRNSTAAMKALQDSPNDLSDVQLNTFKNASGSMINAGLQAEDPQDLRHAANIVNSPGFLRTFDRLGTNPNTKAAADKIGESAVALNNKSIQSQLPGLATPVQTAGSTGAFGMSGAQEASSMLRGKTTHQTFFNPETGRIEIVSSPERKGGVPDRPPQSMQKQVDDVNKSMDAIVHLSDYDYGIKNSKLSEPQLRQLIAVGGGIGNTPGTKLVPLPEELFGNVGGTPPKSFAQSAADTGALIRQNAANLNQTVLQGNASAQTPTPGPTAIQTPSNTGKQSSSALGDYIDTWSQKVGLTEINPHIVAQMESSMDPHATSPERNKNGDPMAVGTFQLVGKTAEGLGVDRNDPFQNVQGGVTLLKQLYDKYGDVDEALRHYRGGTQAQQDEYIAKYHQLNKG